jgi:hypothetical protein
VAAFLDHLERDRHNSPATRNNRLAAIHPLFGYVARQASPLCYLYSAMLQFHLDSTSGVPAYLQIVQQVKRALRLGMLHPGEQLPTARQVVTALAINPNTVLKAYRELEREGLVIAAQARARSY